MSPLKLLRAPGTLWMLWEFVGVFSTGTSKLQQARGGKLEEQQDSVSMRRVAAGRFIPIACSSMQSSVCCVNEGHWPPRDFVFCFDLAVRTVRDYKHQHCRFWCCCQKTEKSEAVPPLPF